MTNFKGKIIFALALFALVVIAGFASASEMCTQNQTTTTPFYRLVNPNGDHFYTISEVEKNGSQTIGYTYEGIAGFMFNSSIPNTVPLYRLANYNTGDHFYTISEVEKNGSQTIGYTYEGIAGYLPANQENGTNPIYRLVNKGIMKHFYTIWEVERDGAQTIGYTYEGITGFMYSTPQTISINVSCNITTPGNETNQTIPGNQTNQTAPGNESNNSPPVNQTLGSEPNDQSSVSGDSNGFVDLREKNTSSTTHEADVIYTSTGMANSSDNTLSNFPIYTSPANNDSGTGSGSSAAVIFLILSAITLVAILLALLMR